MKMASVLLTLTCILLLGVGCASAPIDRYPYDRSTSGCVQGSCSNGYGVYVYPDDDVYKGGWKDGKRHGQGTYYYVDRGSWSRARSATGPWMNGKRHGKFTYVNADGYRRTQYWYNGEDVGSRVGKCRDAKTLTNLYKGFVAIVNAFAAKERGESALEGAAWGYGAASKQAIPLAVHLTCDQLLDFFE